jgi:hypothetical protein
MVAQRAVSRNIVALNDDPDAAPAERRRSRFELGRH